jgi:hypothetical protein
MQDSSDARLRTKMRRGVLTVVLMLLTACGEAIPAEGLAARDVLEAVRADSDFHLLRDSRAAGHAKVVFERYYIGPLREDLASVFSLPRGLSPSDAVYDPMDPEEPLLAGWRGPTVEANGRVCDLRLFRPRPFRGEGGWDAYPPEYRDHVERGDWVLLSLDAQCEAADD